MMKMIVLFLSILRMKTMNNVLVFIASFLVAFIVMAFALNVIK